MKYKILTVIVVSLMIVLTSLVLFGCASSKKSVTSTTTMTDVAKVAVKNKDSITVRSLDSAGVKKDSSATVTREDQSFENKTVVEEEYKYIDTAMKLVKRKTTVIARGKKTSLASVVTTAYDSAHRQAAESTAVKKQSRTDSSGVSTSQVKTKEVTRPGVQWWRWLWWIIMAVFILHFVANKIVPGYYKKLWSFMKGLVS